jgi:protein SCO1
MRALPALAAAVLACGVTGSALLLGPPGHAPRQTPRTQRLPEIASAPGFTLKSQDGAPVSLVDFRGKVAAVTFIFTSCTATCPMLTPMMSSVQGRLGSDFGSNIVFASITVDPERDTPEMLKLYAQAYGADVPGWSFLTGPPSIIAGLMHRYGVFAEKNEKGDIEHGLLTSIVDRRGILRVQYLGARFDPEEFRRDLLNLLREP